MFDNEDQQETLHIGSIKISKKEKAEFDSITGEALAQMDDLDKLRKLEVYMKHEAMLPTAEAARARLFELSSRDPLARHVARSDQGDSRATMEEMKSLKDDLKAWTSKLGKHSAGTIPSAHVDDARPPVRPAAAIHVKSHDSVRKQEPALVTDVSLKQTDGIPQAPKQDSKFGGNVRSGSKYYEGWDKFAKENAEKDSDDEEEKKPTLAKSDPKPTAPAPVASAIPRGPALTKRIIEANVGLSEEERSFTAEQERIKGNESFRSKEYPQAIEHYTVSVALRPNDANMRGNRAAAYLKLRMWAEAEADTSSALALDPVHLKSMLRRSAARMELGNVQGALDDVEAGLTLDPANSELLSMKDRALKELNVATSRRIQIMEEEEEEEEGFVIVNKSKAGSPNAKKTKISIIEQDLSDDNEAPPKPPPDHLMASAPDGVKVRLTVVDVEEEEEEEDQGGESQGSQAESPVTPLGLHPVAPPLAVTVKAPVARRSPEETAKDLKDLGNKCYARSDFANAIQFYSDALKYHPDSAAIYTNRAMTKLKSRDWKGCLADASVAISLDKTSYKALHRRASAKRSLGLLESSRDDLKCALDLLPSGHMDKEAISSEMRGVISLMVEAEKVKAAEARKQKDAAAAAAKQFKYKGGVTIEEHVDEPKDQSTLNSKVMTSSQLQRIEEDASEVAMRARREGGEVRARWAAEHEALLEEQANAKSPTPPPYTPAPSLVAQPPAASPTPTPAAPSCHPAVKEEAEEAVEAILLRGNNLYSQGRVKEALMLYEVCLVKEPNSSTILANVALAKLHPDIDDPEGSLRHCNLILSSHEGVQKSILDKVRHRRAQSFVRLGRLQEALSDYKSVKAALPTSEQIQIEIDALLSKISYEDQRLAVASKENVEAAAAAEVTRQELEAQEAKSRTLALQELAEKERVAGNDLFKQGKNVEAIEAYSRSIQAYPLLAVFSNRSLVLLNLGRASEAESDCREALRLDPSFIKAAHRLAVALKDQGKMTEALESYDKAIALSSKPGALSKEAIEVLVREKEEVRGKVPEKRETKRKIAVNECSDEEEDLPPIPAQTTPSTPTVKSYPIALTPSPSPAPKPSPQTAPTSASPPLFQMAQLHEVASAKASAAIEKLASKLPPPPTSASEFERSAKLLLRGQDLSVLSEFIRSIEPATYPTVFKEGLTENCIRAVCQALLAPSPAGAASSPLYSGPGSDGVSLIDIDPDFAFSCLSSLTKVARFPLVSGMLSKADKEVVTGIFKRLGEGGMGDSFDDVKRKFRA